MKKIKINHEKDLLHCIEGVTPEEILQFKDRLTKSLDNNNLEVIEDANPAVLAVIGVMAGRTKAISTDSLDYKKVLKELKEELDLNFEQFLLIVRQAEMTKRFSDIVEFVSNVPVHNTDKLRISFALGFFVEYMGNTIDKIIKESSAKVNTDAPEFN